MVSKIKHLPLANAHFESYSSDMTSTQVARTLMGRVVKDWRVDAGYRSQQDMSHAAAIPAITLARVEQGTSVDPSTLTKIEMFFGVPSGTLSSIVTLELGTRAEVEIWCLTAIPRAERLRTIDTLRAKVTLQDAPDLG